MIGPVGYVEKVTKKANFDENALAPIGKRENEVKGLATLRHEARDCEVSCTIFARF